MTTCFICHRELKDPKSIERGTGPICAGRHAQDAEIAKRDKFADENDPTPFTVGLVMRRGGKRGDADRTQMPITNIPHLVVHHSPDGFEFGYGGSGPADLALNACQLYLNATGYQGRTSQCYDGSCYTLAWRLHQDFKRAFIETAPHWGAVIPFERIEAWMNDQITVAMLKECAKELEEDFE